MKQIVIWVIFFISLSAGAQNLDSVRQVIRTMGYDLPRLSPVPESVQGLGVKVINLNGTWNFSSDGKSTRLAQKIEVPGEWVMQGFEVAPGTYATYERNFTLPSEWKNKRVKLRCDAVYSKCEIYINSKKAGGHLGGFTAFETDITQFIHLGENNIVQIKVCSESVADSVSNGSSYAFHPLGGISRKIYLIALPEVNCSMFHVSTTFDSTYCDARMKTEVELTNEYSKDAKIDLRFELKKEGDSTVILKKEVKVDEVLTANSILLKNFVFEVKHPFKWDPEHPNLYSLKLSVIVDGKNSEVINRFFGFKQTEIRGNQVFVNNKPIKLRGICRHEAMPLRGRSLAARQWEEDIKLFRAANVNYIRTSHYPPAPELIEACDRLGMFVEVEGPFCWAQKTKKEIPEESYYKVFFQPELEMLNTFRSNPSVLMWSIANESRKYDQYFKKPAALIKAIDPGRPRNYSSYDPTADNGEMEIGGDHYPGPDGPDMYEKSIRPFIFDEYCHLNVHNWYELMTDPGIRDFWGDILFRMWEKMYYSKGVLGGAIWAGIDDTFILPTGKALGHGTWGPIDGWRRQKPEYWHIKKVYSPVKIKLEDGGADSLVTLEVENRYLFSNLNECNILWKNGEQQGTIQPNIGPGEKRKLTLPITYATIKTLSIDVWRESGIPIDQYEFNFQKPLLSNIQKAKEKLQWNWDKDENVVESKLLKVEINDLCLTISNHLGRKIIEGWPSLMLVPLKPTFPLEITDEMNNCELFSPTASNREIEAIDLGLDSSTLKIIIKESYKEAIGKMILNISSVGKISVDYEYKMLTEGNLRQWGLSFLLPQTMNTLRWKRKGLWSVYPDDHIGRLEGIAKLFYPHDTCGVIGPLKKPNWPYSMDQTKYGSNDFRSTKRNILYAILQTQDSLGLKVSSHGFQHVRCWTQNSKIHLLVAEYDNPGAEHFLRKYVNQAGQFDIPAKQGTTISGKVDLQILNIY